MRARHQAGVDHQLRGAASRRVGTGSGKAKAINVDGPRFLAEAAAKTVRRSSISARNTRSQANRSAGRLTRSPMRRRRSTSTEKPKSPVKRRCAPLAKGVTSFAPRGCTAAARRAFSAPCRKSQSRQKSAGHRRHLVEHNLCRRLDRSVITIRRNGVYGIYHVVNAGVCSYYDFALEAAKRARTRARKSIH